MIPSLERLRLLLRAAGFELSIRLAKADPSNHDQVLSSANYAAPQLNGCDVAWWPAGGSLL